MVDFGQLQLADGVPIYLQIIGHLKAGMSCPPGGLCRPCWG